MTKFALVWSMIGVLMGPYSIDLYAINCKEVTVPDVNALESDCLIRHPAPEGGGFRQHLLDYAGRAGLGFSLIGETSKTHLAVYPLKAILYRTYRTAKPRLAVGG